MNKNDEGIEFAGKSGHCADVVEEVACQLGVIIFFIFLFFCKRSTCASAEKRKGKLKAARQVCHR